jgi:hypothetical protein
MKKFETHTIPPVYDRLAQYFGHVPVTAEFEFEYKKLRKEYIKVQSDMEEHDLLEEYERIGAKSRKMKN